MLGPSKTLIVIMGPTAIGKTNLAIKLARHYHTEILSADSRQFYQEMSIGTAKPSEMELAAAKHHFINSHSINYSEFSVGVFETEALAVLSKLFENNDQAILAGGSGLYIQAVCQGFDDIPKATSDTRENLNALFAEFGINALQDYLSKADPEYYNQVDLNNPQRLIRALEVFETTGKPFSSYRIKNINTRPFNIIKIGLNIDRAELYQRINSRVDQMMESGLLDEVKSLLPHRSLNALNTVGYSELFDYLDGLVTLPEAIDKIKQNTRRFAKRQLTWFKRQENIKWFSPSEIEKIISWINLQKLQNPEHGEQKN
jgi:tRNA dimethylallyltransferase